MTRNHPPLARRQCGGSAIRRPLRWEGARDLGRFWVVLTVGVVMAGCSDAPSDRPAGGDPQARVCVRRYEDGGALNLLEASVVLSDQQTISLVGGQAGCAYVLPGSHSVFVQSRSPDDPSSQDPKAWRSETIRFDLKDGQTVEFAVCGGTAGGGHAYDTWVIQPAAEGLAGGPRCG